MPSNIFIWLDNGKEKALRWRLLGLEGNATTWLNAVMKYERIEALGAEPYERTDQRRGYANGYKEKSLNSRAPILDRRVNFGAFEENLCAAG